MSRAAVNRPRGLFALIGLWGVLGFTAPLAADEIRLKNGGVIEGRVIAESAKHIVVEVPYGKMTIARKNIIEVVRESESEYLKDASERILRAGDVEGALDLLRRACQLEPEDGARRAELASALERAIEIWFEGGRLDKVQGALPELAELDADPTVIRSAASRIDRRRRDRADRENRARGAWQDGSVETAYRLWSELRAEFPHRAERWREPLAAAALRLGHDALLGRRLDEARRRYLETLELDPDRIADVREPFALCEIERVRPDLQRGRLDEARRSIAAALEILPDEPALLFHLALVAESAGERREATKIYARLAGEKNRRIEGQKYLDELRRRAASRVQQGVALAFQEKSPTIATPEEPDLSETIRGGPFVVHHAPGFAARPVLNALRRQLRRLERDWFEGRSALPSDLEVAVFLHPGRTALLSRGAPSIEGCDGFVRSVRNYGILLRQEVHLNAEAPRLNTGVVPHELAHLLLPHRIGLGVLLPPWLDEGIACVEEPELLRRHRERLLVEAERVERSIPLSELVAATSIPADRTVEFYSASASVVEFLRDRLGAREMLAFARRTALSDVETALSEIAGYDTVADLEYAWTRWRERKR